MIRISTFQRSYANFKQEIEIGNQVVQIQLIYNIRVGCFFLTFTDQDGNTVYGIKVVPNFPLLWGNKGFVDFDGDLMVVKTDAELGSEVTYDNFGSGWDFVYMDEDEVNQWKEDNGF